MVPLNNLGRENYGCVVMTRRSGQRVGLGATVALEVKSVGHGAVLLLVFAQPEVSVRRETGQLLIGAMEVAVIDVQGRVARLAINAPREIPVHLELLALPAGVDETPREFRLKATPRPPR